MLNTQLKKQWAEMKSAMKASERFYKLDDNHAARVELNAGRFDEDDLTAHLMIFEKIEEKRGDEVLVDWECIDMDSLPSRLLGRVVELKAIVERWNTNELDDLPASTTGNFLADQEDRRLRRRRRRY